MVVLLVVVLAGSAYLLNFALSPQHRSVDEALARLYKHHAYVRPWVDSLKAVSAIHDTMVVINGTRLHAAYIPAPRTSHKVAFLIHGYKDCYAMMLHVGYIYHHLGYNLFLPDLYAHGESEGNHIRMGWLDRLDVMQWVHIANAKFRGDSTSTQMVVHGISMGAAGRHIDLFGRWFGIVDGLRHPCGHKIIGSAMNHEHREVGFFHLLDG